jgi:hypothetical protein
MVRMPSQANLDRLLLAAAICARDGLPIWARVLRLQHHLAGTYGSERLDTICAITAAICRDDETR